MEPVFILPYGLAFLAACAAGFINAIAGGGTLVTFPVLTAIGLSPVVANVTNAVALVPGFLGGIYSQRHDFKEQRKHFLKIIPISFAGGLAGGIILLNTSEASFRFLVPHLILMAAILLALQTPIKNLVAERTKQHRNKNYVSFALLLFVFMASVYGGYFGAGLGVILLAILGLLIDDSLIKLNVIKQAIAFSVNFAAAIYFAFSGTVNWRIAIVMTVGAILGGLIGGKLVGKMQASLLKWIVVCIGVFVAIFYFLK